MKIRLCVPLGGNGFSVAPGEETDRFDDEEALRYIDAGYAVLADGEVSSPAPPPQGTDPAGDGQVQGDAPSGEADAGVEGPAGGGEGAVSASGDAPVAPSAKDKKSSGKKSKGDS